MLTLLEENAAQAAFSRPQSACVIYNKNIAHHAAIRNGSNYKMMRRTAHL